MLITSILHDTIEDTTLDEQMLAVIFDENIAYNVKALTRISVVRQITASETLQNSWKEQRIDLLLIKYFDRFHNLQTIYAKSPAKINKTIKETMQNFLSLSIYLKARIPRFNNINGNIIDLCLKRLEIQRLSQEPKLIPYAYEDQLKISSN